MPFLLVILLPDTCMSLQVWHLQLQKNKDDTEREEMQTQSEEENTWKKKRLTGRREKLQEKQFL